MNDRGRSGRQSQLVGDSHEDVLSVQVPRLGHTRGEHLAIMGWWHEHDEDGHHEGWVVAYVPATWLPSDVVPELHSGWRLAVVPGTDEAEPLRELGSHPLDRTHAIRGIRWVGAACDCGWRSSPHCTSVAWFPNIVERPDELDDQMRGLWLEHVSGCLR